MDVERKLTKFPRRSCTRSTKLNSRFPGRLQDEKYLQALNKYFESAFASVLQPDGTYEAQTRQ